MIYLRKARGTSSPNLYEWRVEGSETWYRIYRDNIHFIKGSGAEKEIIDLAENGETVLVEAFYFKMDIKALIIGNKVAGKK